MNDSGGIPVRSDRHPSPHSGAVADHVARGVGAGKTAPLVPSRRIGLLALATVSGLVVATRLSVRGLSSVNLDAFLEDPWSFYALLAFPSALALLCLALATLPRTLLINLAVFIGLVGAAEAGAWALAAPTLALHGEPEVRQGATFYIPDATLGYALAPSVVARHRRTAGHAEVYDVTYEIDDRGRRHTPTTPTPDRRSFLLFFGDSNTFGEGLGQTDTLPYAAGELATSHRPYNYGVPGYGPQHMLALLNVRRLDQEVLEPDGYAVFFLIPAHIARVIGSSKVSTGWGRHFPYYQLGLDGSLVATGDFVHGRPLTTLLYYFWNKSHLTGSLGVELPARYTEQDYRVTAKILAEGGRRLALQVRLQGFYVVLGQAYNTPQLRVLEELRDALAREGVPYLDYARLLDAKDPRYRVSDLDLHNSGKANRAIAAKLVSDLRIGR